MPANSTIRCARGFSPLAPDDPALLAYQKQAVKRYAFVEKVAHTYGADFLLFWQPCWWVETAPVDPAVKAREQRKIILSDRWAMKPNFVTIYHALWENLRDKPYFVDFRNVLTSSPAAGVRIRRHASQSLR